MLYFVTSQKTEKTWHIGCACPDLICVYEVQADCDELEYIRRNFTNIPFHNGRVVKWTGEFATFIYNGIKSLNPDNSWRNTPIHEKK